jgi:hypothetical protein
MNGFTFFDVSTCYFNMDTTTFDRHSEITSRLQVTETCLKPMHPSLRLEYRDLMFLSASVCSWVSKAVFFLTPTSCQILGKHIMSLYLYIANTKVCGRVSINRSLSRSDHYRLTSYDYIRTSTTCISLIVLLLFMRTFTKVELASSLELLARKASIRYVRKLICC